MALNPPPPIPATATTLLPRPLIRDLCTMDDLVEIDSSVSNEATVCIMVPTAGEKMKNLKHVLLGAYSQRMWPSTLYASRQLRIAVLDEKGRHEVRYDFSEPLLVRSGVRDLKRT